MNQSDHLTEDDETAAERAAQHLANLMQRPVAGFEPEPVQNEGLSSEDIVDGLISGRLKPQPYRTTETDSISFKVDAPYIVLAGLVNGSPELRQRIIETIEQTQTLDKYRTELFRAIKTLIQMNAVTAENLDDIRGRIPEIWNASHPLVLQGHLKAGVLYRWYQMVGWECDEAVVMQALLAIKLNSSRTR